jgi:hypothetical protein
MPRTLTASDRSALIRLASTLPVGSEERKAILAGLGKKAKFVLSPETMNQHPLVPGRAMVYFDVTVDPEVFPTQEAIFDAEEAAAEMVAKTIGASRVIPDERVSENIMRYRMPVKKYLEVSALDSGLGSAAAQVFGKKDTFRFKGLRFVGVRADNFRLYPAGKPYEYYGVHGNKQVGTISDWSAAHY